MHLTIKSALPDQSISHFVHSFWMVENKTGKDVPATVLPNGMTDLILTKTKSKTWEMVIRGIDTTPSQVTIPADTKMFSIGFKLLAVEYLFGTAIKDILNKGKIISDEGWQFEEKDLRNLKTFCNGAERKIKTVSKDRIDSRKKRLFEFVYSSHGGMTVTDISKKVFWNSRQINRYFNQQFGISLKTYCNILRFGASFKHISEGQIFPEQDFTDQNHFIKEIKKYSGVTPKELRKNTGDRFIDLVAIKKLRQKND